MVSLANTNGDAWKEGPAPQLCLWIALTGAVLCFCVFVQLMHLIDVLLISVARISIPFVEGCSRLSWVSRGGVRIGRRPVDWLGVNTSSPLVVVVQRFCPLVQLFRFQKRFRPVGQEMPASDQVASSLGRVPMEELACPLYFLCCWIPGW